MKLKQRKHRCQVGWEADCREKAKGLKIKETTQLTVVVDTMRKETDKDPCLEKAK